jgi:hypothetical protein
MPRGRGHLGWRAVARHAEGDAVENVARIVERDERMMVMRRRHNVTRP